MKILNRIMAGLASGIVIVVSINVQAQSNINTLPLINPDIMEDSVNDVSDVIINITDNIDIQPEKTELSYVYAQEPESYTQAYYSEPVYEDQPLTLTYDEFMSMYGDQLISEQVEPVLIPADTSSEQAAYDQALANYNMALTEYEAASQMVKITKEIEVEIVEEVTDEEGNVTEVTRTEIQTVTEMVPAGDVQAAQVNLDAATAALESARLALETAQAQTTIVELPKVEENAPIPTTIVEPEQQAIIEDDVVVKEEGTQATSGTCGDNLTWTLDDNGLLTILGTGEMEDYDYDYRSPWGTEIKSLNMESGVTSIGNHAFLYCENLSVINIADTVARIGFDSFDGCISLTTITIPDSVTSIEAYAFRDCTSLTGITIPEGVTSISSDVFNGCSSLTKIIIPGSVNSIGYGAFSGCTGIKTAGPIGSGSNYEFGWEDKIPMYAFHGCSELIHVTIPKSVTKIGEDAFSECTGLKTAGPIGSGCNIEFGWADDIPDGAFYRINAPTLTNIIIPDGINRINPHAFAELTGLSEIIIPESVIMVDQFAFYGCSGLTSVKILNSETSIGYNAFSGCTGLKTAGPIGSGTDYEFGWTDTISSYAFAGLSNLTSAIIPDGITRIEMSAFEGCGSLTNVTIPNSAKEIGGYAFRNCTSLTSINIPDGVTYIGDNAFAGCTSLTNVKIPDSVTEIGGSVFDNTPFIANYPEDLVIFGNVLYQYKGNDAQITIPDNITCIQSKAFAGCTDLTNIIIPNSVYKIGSSAFEGCTGLTSVKIPNSETSIGYNAFSGCTGLKTAGPIGSNCDYEFGWTDSIPDYSFSGCTGLTNIVIPDSVTKIGSNAFSNCTGLTSITIPDGITSIPDGAFSGCTGLTNIVIPDSVTEIGFSSFSNCTGLTSITIPDGVTSIQGGAFSGCSNLTSVVIPDSVIEIGSSAFSDCTGLTSITIPDGVTSIQGGAFFGCSNLTNVVIPDSVIEIGSSAFYGTPFVDNNTNDLIILGKVLYEYRGSETEVIIPEGVKSIGDQVFANRTSLTGITLPDTLMSIGRSAFINCSGLTEVVIPDGVTGIGSQAFYNCSSLKNVIIPKSVTSIGTYAFTGTPFLENNTDDLIVLGSVLYRYRGDATEFAIPQGITEIYAEAFSGCRNLKSLTIPDSLVTVGDYAFKDCISLESLYFSEGVTHISYHAFYNCIALTNITFPKSLEPNLTVLNPKPAGCKNLTDVYYLGTEDEWNENKMHVGHFGLDSGQITLHFKKIIPFTDVPEDAWYYSVATECYETGLINGTSATTFSPLQTMTRAMVITILWRMEGQPKTAFNNKFKDVTSKQWYATSISWAVNNGVVNGYGDGTFKPDAAVTREQVAVMLANYAAYKKVYKPGTKKLNTYPDGSQVSTWAQQGMKWALTNGIISGDGAGYLRPKKSATRAEGAAMLLRMKNWLN